VLNSKLTFVICAYLVMAVGTGCFTRTINPSSGSKASRSSGTDTIPGVDNPLPTTAPTAVPNPGATATPSPSPSPTLAPGASPTPTPGPPAVSVTQINTLIQARCISCHGVGGVGGSLVYATNADWIASRSAAAQPMVVAGNPANSILFQRLAGNGMAAPINNNMPLAAAPLTAAEVDLFRQWIQGITP
jgi:mono/diheme cytochrome c family protein